MCPLAHLFSWGPLTAAWPVHGTENYVSSFLFYVLTCCRLNLLLKVVAKVFANVFANVSANVCAKGFAESFANGLGKLWLMLLRKMCLVHLR